MSERCHKSLFAYVLVGLALCLVAVGCQIEVAFVNPANKPSPPAQTVARTPEGPPSPITLTSGTVPDGPPESVMPPMDAMHGSQPGFGPTGPAGHPGDPSTGVPGPIPHEKAMRSLPPYT
jgi:hypothetical protein